MSNIPCLEIRFTPRFAQVSEVRCFVQELYAQLLSDAETAERLAIATHELLENAVKYSADGETWLRVQAWERPDACAASVLTRNRAAAAHLDTIRAYVAEMNAAEDRVAYYLERMRDSSRRADVSQLGLARIHAEADMQVSCAVDGDCLTIKAETFSR